MRLTEEECLVQNRCPEHQNITIDLCPWKHNKKAGFKLRRKKEVNPAKHQCSEHTISRISKGWISFVCSCGLRWGKPHV